MSAGDKEARNLGISTYFPTRARALSLSSVSSLSLSGSSLSLSQEARHRLARVVSLLHWQVLELSQ